MGRPRIPAAVLARRGAFRKNPDRVREDVAGVGPFPAEPPESFDEPHRRAWRDIVSSIEPELLTGSDVSSVTIMAELLCQFQIRGHRTLATELRAWFSQYYVAPAARARVFGTAAP